MTPTQNLTDDYTWIAENHTLQFGTNVRIVRNNRTNFAASFDNGMEFFSTYGGNTVSCAIGLMVLKVVQEEELQEHAGEVGEYLLQELRQLMSRHEAIGDVRGSGLFIGVELVRDRETRKPATKFADVVVNRMREERILFGTDGPFHNVLKIRPPMPFSLSDASRLAETLDRVLSSDTQERK